MNTYKELIALVADYVTNLASEDDLASHYHNFCPWALAHPNRESELVAAEKFYREDMIATYTEDMSVGQVLDEAEMLGILKINR